MGFIEDKNKIVQQVSLFEVLGDLPKTKSISNIPSVRSTSKNLIPFLLDLLSTTCKDKKKNPNLKDRVKCDLIRIITEILVDFFPVFVRILKEGLIKAIKAGIICPADFKIPIPTPTVDLPQKGFDLNKLTTLDPTLFPTKLFFGDNDDDLNVFLTNLVKGGVGSNGTWKNLLDFEIINYVPPVVIGSPLPLVPIPDIALRATINSSYGGKEYDVFLRDYMEKLELFNFKNFIPSIMEEFNGTVSNLVNKVKDFTASTLNNIQNFTASTLNNIQNFTASTLSNVQSLTGNPLSYIASNVNVDIETSTSKEETNKMVEKILDTDPCEQNFFLDDNFFQFSKDELLDIESRSQNRLNGTKLVNYSCTPSLVEINISQEDYNNFEKSLNDNPNQAVLVTKQFTENILTQISNQLAGEEGGTTNLNFNIGANLNLNNSFSFESIKKSISSELAMALPKLGTSVVFTPKIMVLYQVSKKLVTNTVNEYKNSFDFAKANKVFFEYVVRESGAALLKILYEQVKEEVKKIVAELVLSLIKEAVTKRTNQLKSLTSGYTNKAGLSSVDIPDVSNFI